jgi:hypothetical protein
VLSEARATNEALRELNADFEPDCLDGDVARAMLEAAAAHRDEHARDGSIHAERSLRHWTDLHDGAGHIDIRGPVEAVTETRSRPNQGQRLQVCSTEASVRLEVGDRSPIHHARGARWNRTTDLILIRDAL